MSKQKSIIKEHSSAYNNLMSDMALRFLCKNSEYQLEIPFSNGQKQEYECYRKGIMYLPNSKAKALFKQFFEKKENIVFEQIVLKHNDAHYIQYSLTDNASVNKSKTWKHSNGADLINLVLLYRMIHKHVKVFIKAK